MAIRVADKASGLKVSHARHLQYLNDYIVEIAKLKRNTCESLIKLGRLLLEIKEWEIYKERYETFEEFLGSPEVSIGRATAFKAMRVAEVFEDRLTAVTDIDPDKLYRISSVVNGESMDEWIEKARVLSRSDLAQEVREAKGLPPHDSAKRDIEYVREFLYDYCKSKKVEPAELELEELLMMFLKWYKVKFK